MTDSEMLRTLIDTQAITQLLARYARSVDWLDVPAMKACFAEGATVTFGTTVIPAEGFCEFWGGMGAGFKARHHLMGLPTIAFTGADETPNEAYVESAAIVAGTRADEGLRMRDFMECNRYVMTAVRHGEGWRFSAALVFITWSQGAPTTLGMETGGPLDHDVTIANPAYVAI